MKMATIQKRADELKPGDVLAGLLGAPVVPGENPRVVVAVDLYKNGPVVWVFQLGNGPTSYGFGADQTVDVYGSTLTPAQQHAEELADFLREAVTTVRQGAKRMPQWAIDADALLATFDPPEPPTLEEALEALQELTDASPRRAELSDKRLDILDRARRAGLLK